MYRNLGLLSIPCILVLSACQTPINTLELKNRNQSLQQQLAIKNKTIQTLETERKQLQKALNESNRVRKIIGKEKSSRFNESTLLRSQVRRFLQQQIDVYKSFLVNNNLLDYVGGELVKRKQYDNRPLMLVDLKNEIPRPGVLTGVAAWFVKPSHMIVKVLRKIDDKLVVVWESHNLNIRKTGLIKARFHVTVGVEKGDVLGYYFPKAASVAFDKGTGDTRYLSHNLRPGSSISPSSLEGEDQQRAYSLGVYGLLQ
ncbi:hypothetical protein MNBD_GAMMA24-2590 [hydrothermal vent metagenome]|uniref:Uncharacterized protein n=1 Tax=hydrothermal vent metagenome TaxID=652676 RepID=A0A3B1C7L3_9ZZZZ